MKTEKSETRIPAYIERKLKNGFCFEQDNDVEKGIARAHIGSSFLKGFADWRDAPVRISV